MRSSHRRRRGGGSGSRRRTAAANEAYYEGVNYLSQSSSDGQRAVDAFRRAISLDPNHAAAHAGLARGLFTLGFLGATSHQEARVMALTEVNRALALDPDSAEAHAARADLQFYYDWDWAGAEQSRTSARSTSTAVLPAPDRSTRGSSQPRDGARTRFSRPRRPRSSSRRRRAQPSTRAMALYYARDYPRRWRASSTLFSSSPSRPAPISCSRE